MEDGAPGIQLAKSDNGTVGSLQLPPKPARLCEAQSVVFSLVNLSSMCISPDEDLDSFVFSGVMFK